MANLVVAETHVPDIVSTLSAALPYLSSLIDSGEAYMRSSYEVLRDSILHLCDQLNLCKNQFNDVAGRERLLLRARISASKIFSLVYSLHNSPHGLLHRIFCCCACADTERIENLKLQSDETQRLAADISTFLRQGTNSDQQHGQESETMRNPSAGVNKLELVTPRSLESKIAKGEKVRFTVSDSSQRRVYTATTWLNNPSSWFGTAKRMSASLETATARGYDIRLPEEKQSVSGSCELNAFISSGGSLHGTVTSIMVESGIISRRAGSLLVSRHFRTVTHVSGNHMDGTSTHTSREEYDEQRYHVLLAFSHIQILGLHNQGVGQVQFLGRKKERKTYYECFVEATGEVLAIYRHNQDTKIGVLHFLGVGNKPEVRDLIFSTMVAMGLTRDL